LEESQLRLIVRLPEEPLYLDADPVRISQVLVNLLNNAGKHTGPSGEVWLTAERSPLPAGIDAEKPLNGAGASADARSAAGEEVILRVRDTGSGIPASLLPHVFDMFTQGPRTTQQGRGGLGVGLALVRNLVEMHGGTVKAYSAGPGEGAEFVVRLPMAAAPNETAAPAAYGQGSVARADHRRG
jgi:signal transduction histidine kinase